MTVFSSGHRHVSPAHKKHTMAIRAGRNNPVALSIASARGWVLKSTVPVTGCRASQSTWSLVCACAIDAIGAAAGWWAWLDVPLWSHLDQLRRSLLCKESKYILSVMDSSDPSDKANYWTCALPLHSVVLPAPNRTTQQLDFPTGQEITCPFLLSQLNTVITTQYCPLRGTPQSYTVE